MIVVKVVPNLQQMREQMNRIEREQMPYAVGTALTRTARFVAKKIQEEMPRVFDRPTRWALNSLYVDPANKRKQWALVKVKDRDGGMAATGSEQPQVNTLGPHIFRGPRSEKRAEVLLKRAGHMLPGQYLVPGAGAKLDRYGNISRAQMQQILSALSAQYDEYQNSKATKRGKKRRGNRLAGRIFSVKTQTGHLRPGVYERVGQYRLTPLLVFVGRPMYPKRLRFFEMAEQVGAMRFPLEFKKAMRESVRFALARRR